MTRVIKFSLFVFSLVSLLSGLLLSQTGISAQAATNLRAEDIVEVNVNALNVRQSPCGKVEFVAKKFEQFSISSSKPVYCKINGVTYTFYKAYSLSRESGIGYIAGRYVTKISNLIPTPYFDSIRASTNISGLNIRQAPCGKVIGSVRAGTIGRIESLETQLCTLNGQRHMFIKVSLKGKVGYVSGNYIYRYLV